MPKGTGSAILPPGRFFASSLFQRRSANASPLRACLISVFSHPSRHRQGAVLSGKTRPLPHGRGSERGFLNTLLADFCQQHRCAARTLWTPARERRSRRSIRRGCCGTRACHVLNRDILALCLRVVVRIPAKVACPGPRARVAIITRQVARMAAGIRWIPCAPRAPSPPRIAAPELKPCWIDQ